MSELKEWVAGFLLDRKNERVLLIRKARPEWQRGKLNGVGGKVEPGETPAQAMRREFLEEAGIVVEGWREFCTYHWREGVVHFFTADWGGSIEPRTMTDEPVMWKARVVMEWPEGAFIQNLRWLVPLAFDKDASTAVVHEPDAISPAAKEEATELCAKCGLFRLHPVHTYQRDPEHHLYAAKEFQTDGPPVGAHDFKLDAAKECKHGCLDGRITETDEKDGGYVDWTRPCPDHGPKVCPECRKPLEWENNLHAVGSGGYYCPSCRSQGTGRTTEKEG